MSSQRDQQLQAAREVDRMSTALINVGVRVVKNNKLKVGGYIIGLLLCLFFSGWKVTDVQRNEYYAELEKVDHTALYETEALLYQAHTGYQRSKGWFSCDAVCQSYKNDMQVYQREYDRLKKDEALKIASAKSKLGIFSEYGVEETRNLFWERFGQGKGFAQRQTKWDALFMGMSAMGRDEKLVSYLLRLVMSFLFNFTIGVVGAVIVFICNLYSLIQSFQANFFTGLVFFAFASLAAVSFAMTWLIGLYAATAGTVYVGAKLIASNMRIEDDPEARRRQYQRRL